MEEHWYTYQGALLWGGKPNGDMPTIEEARDALKQSKAMFARWTTDFDCGVPTKWWFCLKERHDTIEQLSAKQRYRIRRGLMNCIVKRLSESELSDNIDAIFDIAVLSFSDYPIKYRPNLQKKEFVNSLLTMKDREVWVAWDAETNEIIGYGYCILKGNVIYLSQVKVPTIFLNKEVNAALVYKMSEYYLGECAYDFICDGERNIKHESNYQDFLVRVLNFRYAYCKLNILYSPMMRFIVTLLFPCKNVFRRLSAYNGMPFKGLLYNVYCVLYQEEIRRSFK